MAFNPKHKTHVILEGRDRAPARSYLKGIGFSEADLARPIIGIANTWIETMPCNFHLRELAVKVKKVCARLVERQWNSIQLLSATASRWERKG